MRFPFHSFVILLVFSYSEVWSQSSKCLETFNKKESENKESNDFNFTPKRNSEVKALVQNGKAQHNFIPNKKGFQIRELNVFDSIPLPEEKIVQRVLSGEDIRLVDVNQVRKNYQTLKTVFSDFDIHLAYKAFLSLPVLDKLGKKSDLKFEIATVEEFQSLEKAGISPENIIFTHTDKDAVEISTTFKGGVRTYVSDSVSDLSLLSQYAPGANVLIRVSIHTDSNALDIEENFDERFGMPFEKAGYFISKAKKLNLNPVGIAFHIGTQRKDATEWIDPIKKSAKLFREMKQKGINLTVLDIGGGFPMRHSEDIPQLQQFGETIKQALSDHFSQDIYPKSVVIEPGRFTSASAGVTVGRIINVKPSHWIKNETIVTASTGRYSAGVVITGYKFSFYGVNKNKGQLVFSHLKEGSNLGDIYGKASASIDKLSFQKELIPTELKSGDLIVIQGTGAYSGEVSTTTFCKRKSPTNIFFDSKTGFLIDEGKPPC